MGTLGHRVSTEDTREIDSRVVAEIGVSSIEDISVVRDKGDDIALGIRVKFWDKEHLMAAIDEMLEAYQEAAGVDTETVLAAASFFGLKIGLGEKGENPGCVHCQDRGNVYVNGNEYQCAWCLNGGTCTASEDDPEHKCPEPEVPEVATVNRGTGGRSQLHATED